MQDFNAQFVNKRALGSFTFGQAFKVSRRGARDIFALKVFNVADYDITVEEAQEEFSSMMDLEHKNILPVIDFVKCDNNPWKFAILMEYCPEDLSLYLKEREGYLRKKRLLEWMIDLASAVEYIHSKGIMHRDLKPGNILVRGKDSLLICNFGIPSIMTQYYANTKSGTLDFMAPEVLEEVGYTEKADIYSLGKVFICMATLGDAHCDTQDLTDRYGPMIADAMDSCTKSNPDDRLDASSLLSFLETIQKPLIHSNS